MNKFKPNSITNIGKVTSNGASAKVKLKESLVLNRVGSNRL